MGRSRTLRAPFVSYILCALCGGMFLLQMRGTNLHPGNDVVSYPGYVDAPRLFQGEYWGLLSSFFLHASLPHVAFNVYWLYLFGRAVEPFLGWRRFLLFWLCATAFSSMMQVAFSGQTGVGASGFGYALFGFIWIGSRTDPALAHVLDRQTVGLFVIWLFICIGLSWSGTMAIGNAAHFGGAIFGGLCAYVFLELRTREWKWAFVAGAVLGFFPLFYAPWLGEWNLAQGTKGYDHGKYDTALAYFDRVHTPGYETYITEMRANCLSQLNRQDEAVAVYKDLLDSHSEGDLSDPGYAYNEYAWILATSPNDKLRNPAEAIHYAQMACEKDNYNDADSLDTLASAYASAGQFDQAVSWEQKALDAHPEAEVLADLKARLELFKAGKPFHDNLTAKTSAARN